MCNTDKHTVRGKELFVQTTRYSELERKNWLTVVNRFINADAIKDSSLTLSGSNRTVKVKTTSSIHHNPEHTFLSKFKKVAL